MNANAYLKQKAEDWYKKGNSDIRSAKILIKDSQPPTDTVCFHCQQAAEKYLKGYLTSKGVEFAKSHDLDYLLKLCIDVDESFEDYREAVLFLNKYAINPRYPADIPIEYSVEEAKRAIVISQEVIGFIEKK